MAESNEPQKPFGFDLSTRIAELGKESGENLAFTSDVKSSLRTRIAAALRTAPPLSDDLGLADAVIEALGLTKASRPNDYRFFRYPPGDRYITKWLADE